MGDRTTWGSTLHGIGHRAARYGAAPCTNWGSGRRVPAVVCTLSGGIYTKIQIYKLKTLGVSGSTQLQNSLEDFAPSETIRVDNVFARMPVHRIAKKGHANIRIIERDAEENGGQVRLYWKVDPNERGGEPGPLAYRIDRLVINRCLDEAGRPLPRILPLPDLRAIAREVGLGGDTNTVKRLLKQLAFVGITAKLTYRDRDGNEQRIDNHFTRYNVIFRGGVVNGRRAERGYLVLNDPFYSLLNNSHPRPMDYEYLKRLPPAAQRLYELISPRMYAMFRLGWNYAEIPYSELCLYTPLARHGNRQRIQSQLARIHRRHLAEQYISGVEYRNTTDRDGHMDLLLRYYPGRKAIAEHLAYNGTIKKGPYRATAGGLAPRHPIARKQAARGLRMRNSALSDGTGSPERLAIRFEELRHGIQDCKPSHGQVGYAQELLKRCDGDVELGLLAVSIAAQYGRESGEARGFPTHLSGVIAGPFIDLARAELKQRQEQKQRTAERQRDQILRREYEEAMEARAQERLAKLTDEEKRPVIEDRLERFLHDYRWLIRSREWDRSQAREWAVPRILKGYARESEPPFKQWLSARSGERGSR